MIDQEKFCEKCGARLEKEKLHFQDLGWVEKIYFKFFGYKKFNQQTGEENFIIHSKCPKGCPGNYKAEKQL